MADLGARYRDAQLVPQELTPEDEEKLADALAWPAEEIAGALAPGVRGYTVENEAGDLYVPVIVANDEGSGDVGRFLDSLPADRRVVVPNVINERMAGMLLRRGFAETVEWAESFDEWVTVFERKPGGGSVSAP